MDNNLIAVYKTLKKVCSEDSYSNIALNEILKDADADSESYVRMMVKGVIENTIQLDYYIEKLAKNGLRGIKKKNMILLRMGLFEIIYSDKVPDYAAVNEIVELSKKVSKGNAGFINGVLRSFLRTRDSIKLPSRDKNFRKYLSVKYSFPEELLEFWEKQYGAEQTEKIIKATNEIYKMNIRTNLLKISREKLIEELKESEFIAEASKDSDRGIAVTGGKLLSNDIYKKGYFSVQGESSIMAVEAFAPEKNSSVLDMCAAPGGKSFAMAEKMNGEGSITACDMYKHRLELIDKEARRLGIKIVSTCQADSSVYNEDFEGDFDYVLADVPCSGLGVIRSKPEIKYRVKINELDDLYSLQKKIIENAYRYTAENGYFMYSTCTINKYENEYMIEEFKRNHEFVEIVEKRLILPYNNRVGFFYCKMKKIK